MHVGLQRGHVAEVRRGDQELHRFGIVARRDFAVRLDQPSADFTEFLGHGIEAFVLGERFDPRVDFLALRDVGLVVRTERLDRAQFLQRAVQLL